MSTVISFVGWSGSGKTTFLRKVIKELKGRGLAVAVVKNTCQHMEPDIQGKDTWAFARAGADTVILNGPTVFFRQEKVSARKDIAAVLEGITGVDIIILEGAGDSFLPKVEVWRKACGKGHRFPSGELIALVAEGLPEKSYRGLPQFKHGEVCRFTDFLLYKAGLEGAPPTACLKLLKAMEKRPARCAEKLVVPPTGIKLRMN